MQEQIFKVKDKKIKSVKKFQDLYKSNLISDPKIIAKNIIKFLDKIEKIKTGSFIDLRHF